MPAGAAVRRLARWASVALLMGGCSAARVFNAIVPDGGVRITRDVAYGPLPRQTLDIYRPDRDADGSRVVVFFYGGSWKEGSKSIYPFVGATLARAGITVVIPDYRVYPAVRYPDFLRDCAQSVAWVEAHPDRTGTGALFLMGHSAGAYNALMLGLDPEWLHGAGADPRRIAGVIGLAGPYDFLPITEDDIRPIFPDAGPATQPVTYAGRDAPPTLLLAGTADEQVRPRNSQILAARLQADGAASRLVLYPGLGHVGLVTAIAPALQWRAPVFRDIVAFIRDGATAPLPSRPGAH